MTRRSYGPYVFESSNEDKVLFPEAGLTKGDLISYYERIAQRILPHLEGRPLSLKRFPDGIDAEGFHQKQVGTYFPDFVTTVRVELRGSDERQDLAVCDKKASLAFLADQACIELHPWLSRTDALDCPDEMVIDLDPPEERFEPVRAAALRVRELCEDLGLTPFAKLTGSRGVHVVVPLDRSTRFDDVRSFARAAMDLLARRHDDTLTTEQRKRARRGRLYLDTGSNAYGQTAVAPWSVRARPEAPVAAPIRWSDLERGEVEARDFTVRNVFRRIAQREEAWSGMRRHAASLGPARERLRRMESDGGG